MKFYNTCIRGRLCFCCEIWTLTNKQYKQIETVHTQFLRRMVRGGTAHMSSKKEMEEAKAAATMGDDIQMIRYCQFVTHKKTEDYIKKQNVK